MDYFQDNVPDHLKCPICIDIPWNNVFQCQNGHTICEVCYGKLVNKQCPQCRVEFPRHPIRCRAVEEMLNKLEFPCKFQSAGCEQKLNKENVERHTSSCKYDIQTFGHLENMCQFFGFQNCSFTLNRGNIEKALAHFQSVHGMRSPKAFLLKDFSFTYEDFMDIYNSPEATIFAPIIFDQKWWGHGCVYIIATRFNPLNKTLQFTPFYLIRGWKSSGIPKNAIPEKVEFLLGSSSGKLSAHNLSGCQGLTLDDFSHFAAPLRNLFNVDKPGTFHSILRIKLSGKNSLHSPLIRDGVVSEIKYRPRDTLNQIFKNQRWSTLIRQAFSVGTPQDWDKFRWIACQDFEDFKSHFPPTLTPFSQNEKMLICRTNFNGKWLAGCVQVDNGMNMKSYANFLSPDFLTRSKLITLKENFEVLYTPPNSFEWAPWTDLKDKEVIPVHDAENDLLICVTNSYSRVPFVGTVKKDKKLDVNFDLRVLVLSEKGKGIAKPVKQEQPL